MPEDTDSCTYPQTKSKFNLENVSTVDIQLDSHIGRRDVTLKS